MTQCRRLGAGIAAACQSRCDRTCDYRLLANTIAHQWWGFVSPASRDDWWLEDGFARIQKRVMLKARRQAGLEEA